MKSLLSKITLLLMAILALGACSEADEAAEEYGFEYDQTAMTVTFDAEPTINSEEFSFTSYMAWSASLKGEDGEDVSDWISVTPTSGVAGYQTIKITVEDNDSYEMRTCYATVTSGIYNISITIYQKGLVDEVVPEVKVVSGIDVDVYDNATFMESDFQCEFNYNEGGALAYMAIGSRDYEIAFGQFEQSDDCIYDMQIGDYYYKLEGGKVTRFLENNGLTYSIGTIYYEGDYISEVVIDYYTNDSYSSKTSTSKYVCTWSSSQMTKVENYYTEDSDYISEGCCEFTYSDVLMSTNIDLNEVIMSELSVGRGGEFYTCLAPLRSMGYLGSNSTYLLSTATDMYPSGNSTEMTIDVEELDQDGAISVISTTNGYETDLTFSIIYE